MITNFCVKYDCRSELADVDAKLLRAFFIMRMYNNNAVGSGMYWDGYVSTRFLEPNELLRSSCLDIYYMGFRWMKIAAFFGSLMYMPSFWKLIIQANRSEDEDFEYIEKLCKLEKIVMYRLILIKKIFLIISSLSLFVTYL